MSSAIDAIHSCAATLRVSPGAVLDTDAIRFRFGEVDQQRRANLAQGMTPRQALENTPRMIPDQVATHGAQIPGRAQETNRMIGCVGDRAGLHPGVTEQLQGMYGDAVAAKQGGLAAFRRLLGL
jgi:hypothetical protein